MIRSHWARGQAGLRGSSSGWSNRQRMLGRLWRNFVCTLLNHVGIDPRELGCSFHPFRDFEPTKVISIREVSVDCSNQLQILGRIQCPAILGEILLRSELHNLEYPGAIVEHWRHVLALILPAGHLTGPPQCLK